MMPVDSASNRSVGSKCDSADGSWYSTAIFIGKNRKRFFRYRALFAAAKSVVFAACLLA
jgi:hypothetical protein